MQKIDEHWAKRVSELIPGDVYRATIFDPWKTVKDVVGDKIIFVGQYSGKLGTQTAKSMQLVHVKKPEIKNIYVAVALLAESPLKKNVIVFDPKNHAYRN